MSAVLVLLFASLVAGKEGFAFTNLVYSWITVTEKLQGIPSKGIEQPPLPLAETGVLPRVDFESHGKHHCGYGWNAECLACKDPGFSILIPKEIAPECFAGLYGFCRPQDACQHGALCKACNMSASLSLHMSGKQYVSQAQVSGAYVHLTIAGGVYTVSASNVSVSSDGSTMVKGLNSGAAADCATFCDTTADQTARIDQSSTACEVKSMAVQRNVDIVVEWMWATGAVAFLALFL